jgi:hypothetical protein
LLRGLDREDAPRFSFLLSAPIILGGGLLTLKDVLKSGFSVAPALAAVGFIAAAVSGYLAIMLLLGMVRRGRLDRFAWYCAIVGVGMLAYWSLLVPKIAKQTVAVWGKPTTIGINRDGAFGAVEIGDRVWFNLLVKPGVIPLTAAYAESPNEDKRTTSLLHFSPETVTPKGEVALSSEIFNVYPLSNASPANPDGETREFLVILRNKLGIENSVRLRLQVVPASPTQNIA